MRYAQRAVRAAAVAAVVLPALLASGAQAADNVFARWIGKVATLVAPLYETEPAEAVKVIGAGFGRTGTSSLKVALDRLGYRTHHMIEVVTRPAQLRTAYEYLSGNDPGAEQFISQILADGFDATMDHPGCLIWEELMHKFPDAKVILTTRESPEAWLASLKALMNFARVMRSQPLDFLIGSYKMQHQMFVGKCDMEDTIWEPWYMPWVSHVTERRILNDTQCIQYYNEHVARVRATVPKERLLDYSVKQGWGPLCAFLGHPVPDGPFPHINSKSELLASEYFFTFVAVAYPALALLPALLLWRCCCAGRGGRRPKTD